MRKLVSADTLRQRPIQFAAIAVVVLIVVGALSISALGSLQSVNDQRQPLTTTYMEISELSLAQSARSSRVQALLLTADPTISDGLDQQIGALSETVDDVLGKRDELAGPDDVQAEIDALFEMVEESNSAAVDALSTGGAVPDTAALVALASARAEVETQVEETMDSIEESIEVLDTEQAAVYAQAQARIIVVGAVASAILLVFGLISSARLAQRLRRMREREGFQAELAQAFDVVDEEEDVHEIASRVMVSISDRPTELILVDTTDDDAVVDRIGHAVAGGPGCGVGDASGCMAIRRGQPTQFDTATGVGSCPEMVGRPEGPCSAVCVPVSFMGQTLGVLHQTGPENDQPSSDQVRQLSMLAASVGSRLGAVRAYNQSQHLARRDPLTGLMNRRALEEQLSEVMADGQVVAFAMGDVDYFKRLNDTFGHDTGDKALAALARVMTTSLRSCDVVCRWGGEEFAIAMPGVDAAASLELLERVRQALVGELRAGGLPPFTVSFGLADTRFGRHIETLVRVADEALYLAKEQGRDRVVSAAAIADTGDELQAPRAERTHS